MMISIDLPLNGLVVPWAGNMTFIILVTTMILS